MNHQTEPTPRENFLMGLLHKVVKEYKTLLEQTRRAKPFKIIDIAQLSAIPGETEFVIQIANKNCVLHLTAAEIISASYNLDDFNDFHADMIRQAAQGKLVQFLKLAENDPIYKISSKKFDRETQQHIFTIETKEHVLFTRTAEELSKDINLLKNMGVSDIYEIGYTQGSESVLKEKLGIMLLKQKLTQK